VSRIEPDVWVWEEKATWNLGIWGLVVGISFGADCGLRGPKPFDILEQSVEVKRGFLGREK
jgi:hypothetical protein